MRQPAPSQSGRTISRRFRNFAIAKLITDNLEMDRILKTRATCAPHYIICSKLQKSIKYTHCKACTLKWLNSSNRLYMIMIISKYHISNLPPACHHFRTTNYRNILGSDQSDFVPVYSLFVFVTYRITYRMRPPQGTGSASGVKQTWTVQ